MSRFIQLEDGVGITIPNREVIKFACCDCGLVHDMAVYAPKLRKGTEIGFAVKRNKRATAQRRRKILKSK